MYFSGASKHPSKGAMGLYLGTCAYGATPSAAEAVSSLISTEGFSWCGSAVSKAHQCVNHLRGVRSTRRPASRAFVWVRNTRECHSIIILEIPTKEIIVKFDKNMFPLMSSNYGILQKFATMSHRLPDSYKGAGVSL